MTSTKNIPEITFSFCTSYIYLSYEPETERAICDICDMHGRILQTVRISSSMTEIDIRKLTNSKYILLILDGDKIINKTFTVER